jgi:hypothetical protein
MNEIMIENDSHTAKSAGIAKAVHTVDLKATAKLLV